MILKKVLLLHLLDVKKASVIAKSLQCESCILTWNVFLSPIKDPAKYLKFSFSENSLTVKKYWLILRKALSKMFDGVLLWRGLYASECKNIKSFKKVAVQAILKNGSFHSIKYRRY